MIHTGRGRGSAVLPTVPTIPSLVAFDLDDTLAPSKTRLDETMAALLAELLQHTEVCVISGGTYEQFRRQLLAALPPHTRLDGLHLMPTCGTTYYRWDGHEWQRLYSHELSADQRRRAIDALDSAAHELGLWPDTPWGPVIEDRGSQITFSALGQQAPVDAKHAWDPDGARKEALRALVAPQLPDLETRSGGSTSIDITLQGVDKAYGIARLADALGLGYAQLVFVGDRLDEGGNDYPVKGLGVACYPVTGWTDTSDLVAGWLRGWATEVRAG